MDPTVSVGASKGALVLLGKLGDECARLQGVRREMCSLTSELSSMDGMLKKYTKLEDPDDQVKEWISQMRELTYDTEDCSNKLIHHLGNGGGYDVGFNGFFCEAARSLKTLGARREIADQIDGLKARVKKAKEFKSCCSIDNVARNLTSSKSVVDSRLLALFYDEAHLVGIDGPRDVLAKWMLDEGNGSTKHHCKVLSIVGLGGLGKTTLANEVYRKIGGHFSCRVFVSVSQKPDTKKIIKQIIEDVISQVSCEDEFTRNIDAWGKTKSITKLRELLHDKRYLIVIDDIWSILAWNSIKYAFQGNNCSSRIIATTRNLEVAASCSPGDDDHIYKMTPLSNFHSERLFFNNIFGSEDCCPDMLKEVSNAILKKCGGLPLAIISISGLLANIPCVKENWEKVKRSIGSELNRNQSLQGMKNILSLSYNDLAPTFKNCLLYLSNFPEDCVIEREQLVRRWIAEGFISEEHGQSKQEVAEKYFYELINKSMVQPVDIRYDDKVHACRVHGMMLELIISKSIEENFISVVSGKQTVHKNSKCFVRRLSIQQIDQELASELSKKDLSHVRSLTVTSSGCKKQLPSLAEFETLRVLDFEGCKDLEEYDMNGMDNLFQLKYLSFWHTNISKVPYGIVMLHDLETLDLRNTSIKELPAEIVGLTKLQRLVGGDKHFIGEIKIPVGISNMTNLQEISGFNITTSSVDAVEELGNMINLIVLNVLYKLDDKESHKYKIHEEMLFSSLCRLGTYKLQSLILHGGDSSPFGLLDSWSPLPSCLQRFEMWTDYFLSNLPKWIAPALTSLSCLDINLSEVTQEDLRILGELPALLFLALSTDIVQKDMLRVQGRGFLILKEFVYKTSGAGAGILVFEKWAMPKLEKLEECLSVSLGKAYGFYIGIEHLPCVKNVKVTLRNQGATSFESKTAELAIRKEANVHPNHPRLILK